MRAFLLISIVLFPVLTYGQVETESHYYPTFTITGPTAVCANGSPSNPGGHQTQFGSIWQHSVAAAGAEGVLWPKSGAASWPPHMTKALCAVADTFSRHSYGFWTWFSAHMFL